MQLPQDLVDERLVLPRLLQHKVSPTLLRNLDKSITRHILHA
jgi:hypothetical protein